ncbi:hypothetical protein GALMADRAFT_71467 [Galerina marginata CBS 339.88]|uniref:Amidohydrolase-related domain-containing protein n=1 Tax=Galerina marginata (strain CBS 339.88) TaxID=685588 RepID=A0A067T524_GALM3|nr:hypothetical protein GALMADRAFT_71467 [Galerina marginata CBS 339.88]
MVPQSKSDTSTEPEFPSLFKAAFTQLAIDNHAHPLLREDMRDKLAFEGLISEAEGEALTEDAVDTLACFRATKQLAQLFGLDKNTSWEEVKRHRAAMRYMDLCKLCFKDAGIHSILIDDGLGGAADMAEGYKWHDQLTEGKTKRIVRVEIVAEVRVDVQVTSAELEGLLDLFEGEFKKTLTESAREEDVVGFKSIVCYRTGMNVSVVGRDDEKVAAFAEVFEMYKSRKGEIRLAHKALNDEIVRIALGVAGECRIPVQFHTGLGDSDITLTLASPAHLQPVIKAFPETQFVLLHSSYPYTREAGYLTAVYRNVYLDFGEVFPFVSGDGQRTIIRQVLELAPTNKIMWSSDGHWWPESYYLGVFQAREALYEVLSEFVRKEEMTEGEAVKVIGRCLYDTAARVYQL